MNDLNVEYLRHMTSIGQSSISGGIRANTFFPTFKERILILWTKALVHYKGEKCYIPANMGMICFTKGM